MTLERALPGRERFPLHPGLALLSIVAILSLSLEIELLQQIDGLRLYLTASEIALEAGVALLISIAIATVWWLTIFLAGQAARLLLPDESFSVRWSWNFWLAVPLAYLLLELFQDLKLELKPHWHAGVSAQFPTAVAVSCACAVGLFLVDWSSLQRFCRTRLIPIAWIHIMAAAAAAIGLGVHGVRLFHNYERPSNTATNLSAPDIYLISIDTLRAEDMSVYGYQRPTTPNIDKFAQHAFAFDYYFSNSNFTTPGSASIETGKLPWSHRIYQGSGFLRGHNQSETLPAVLQAHGYYTAMITSNLLAAPFRHRTLDSYDAVQYASPKGFVGFRFRETNLIGVNTQVTVAFSLLRGVSMLLAYVDHVLWRDRYPSPAEDAFQRSEKLLERHPGPQPVFLWTHIMPPHEPYWVPPSYRNHFVSTKIQNYDSFMVPDSRRPQGGATLDELRASYDEMVQYADHSVGDFLQWLDQTGRLDRSIVIITSDHGELFDHGRLLHGGPELYNGVIRIPLLIHVPGQKESVHIEQLAQQVDLLPTVLDLIAAPLPDWTEGSSLKPLLNRSNMPDRYIFSMNLEPNRIFDPITKGTVAVMDDNFKFVRHLNSGVEELYRYKDDSSEEHNLLQSEPAVGERMRRVLLQKIEGVNQRFHQTGE